MRYGAFKDPHVMYTVPVDLSESEKVVPIAAEENTHTSRSLPARVKLITCKYMYTIRYNQYMYNRSSYMYSYYITCI